MAGCVYPVSIKSRLEQIEGQYNIETVTAVSTRIDNNAHSYLWEKPDTPSIFDNSGIEVPIAADRMSADYRRTSVTHLDYCYLYMYQIMMMVTISRNYLKRLLLIHFFHLSTNTNFIINNIPLSLERMASWMDNKPTSRFE